MSRMKEFWASFRRALVHSGPGYDLYAEEREAWQREKLDLYAVNREQLQHFHFLRDVLDLFYDADVRPDLLWRPSSSRRGHLELSANVSDVFAWGSADAEDITPETLPVLHEAYTDLIAIGASATVHLADLYAARIRGMRPQGAAYPSENEAVALLLDACGPERTTGLGNPRPRPTYTA